MKEELTLSEARALRVRFFEGDLSQAEAHRLACFVCGDACPQEWRGERDFWVLHLVGPTLPPDFAAKLEAHMKHVEEETATAEKETQTPRRIIWKRHTTWAVAASAALALGFAGWHYRKPKPEATPMAVAVTNQGPRAPHEAQICRPNPLPLRAEEPGDKPAKAWHRQAEREKGVAARAPGETGVHYVTDRSPDDVYEATVGSLPEALAICAEVEGLLRESAEAQRVTCIWQSLFEGADYLDAADEPAEMQEAGQPLPHSNGDVLQISF